MASWMRAHRELAPASKAKQGWTEMIRRWLQLRWEEARILIAVDRSMMFDAYSAFKMRSTRAVSSVREALWSSLLCVFWGRGRSELRSRGCEGKGEIDAQF